MTVQTVAMTIEKLIGGEELLAMGDVGRCELVEGKIIRLGWNPIQHGGIVGNFCDALYTFVHPRQLGVVMVGEVGIYTRRNPDTVRGADVLFISKERAAKLTSPGYLDVAPELVVEVMSPDDRWSEIMQKLREYFAIGVRLVWVADPDPRTVYAYRSPTDVRLFTESKGGVTPPLLPGDDVLPGFSAAVASLFEE